jgi:hypothetical protein
MREVNGIYICEKFLPMYEGGKGYLFLREVATNVWGRLRLSMSVRGCYQCMRESKVIYVCERWLPMYGGG